MANGEFKIECKSKGRPSITLHSPNYRAALREATAALLGDAGDSCDIVYAGAIVAKGHLRYQQTPGRGGKFSVAFSGEKPAKR